MQFTKAHGTGNDFVVLLDRDDQLDLSEALVRALCDRRFGIGADGVLRIGPSDRADVFMDYRNADGSIVEMCGNGVRVVAKHVLDRNPSAGDQLKIDTRAGIKPVTARRGEDGKVVEVTVDMGPPTASIDRTVDLDDQRVEVVTLSMGNPHAVLTVDDLSGAPVTTLGPRIETHPDFPDGVNVEFARVATPDRIDLRVWERGVGETAACGTGACATQVALHRLGKVGSDVAVHVRGGVLRVQWHAEGSSVLMTGPAVEVASGELSADWLDEARRGNLRG